MNAGRWLLIVLIGIVAWRCDSIASRSNQAAAPPKSPEQIEADQRAARAREQEMAELQHALGVTTALRASLNNPASFQLESLVRIPADGTLCFEYRGTNAFNAIVKNYAVVRPGGPTVSGASRSVVSAWNRYCADKPNNDLTRAVARFL